jgi:hypothetical protein
VPQIWSGHYGEEKKSLGPANIVKYSTWRMACLLKWVIYFFAAVAAAASTLAG